MKGPKQAVLRDLARLRFADAQALARTGVPERRNGAMYLAGYGVECGLKALVCLARGDSHLDAQYFHHDLRALAQATGRWDDICRRSEWLTRPTYLETQWQVAMRYERRSYRPDQVTLFIERARESVAWLSES